MEIQLTNEIEEKFKNYLIDIEESENTIKQYLYCLKSYKQEIGNILNKVNLRKYKEILLANKKPKTVNVRIAGIIKFIKFYANYKKDKRYEEIIIKNVKMQNKTYLNNVISVEEFRKMYEYTKQNKKEKYYFIVKFMGYTGARTVYGRLMQLDKESIVQDDLKRRNELNQCIKAEEKYKELYHKALVDLVKADRENIQLKKQIDLMAEEINETDRGYTDYCEMKIECDRNCKDCIKRYYERKSKE